VEFAFAHQQSNLKGARAEVLHFSKFGKRRFVTASSSRDDFYISSLSHRKNKQKTAVLLSLSAGATYTCRFMLGRAPQRQFHFLLTEIAHETEK
jgi:hypothetical protein